MAFNRPRKSASTHFSNAPNMSMTNGQPGPARGPLAGPYVQMNGGTPPMGNGRRMTSNPVSTQSPEGKRCTERQSRCRWYRRVMCTANLSIPTAPSLASTIFQATSSRLIPARTLNPPKCLHSLNPSRMPNPKLKLRDHLQQPHQQAFPGLLVHSGSTPPKLPHLQYLNPPSLDMASPFQPSLPIPAICSSSADWSTRLYETTCGVWTYGIARPCL